MRGDWTPNHPLRVGTGPSPKLVAFVIFSTIFSTTHWEVQYCSPLSQMRKLRLRGVKELSLPHSVKEQWFKGRADWNDSLWHLPFQHAFQWQNQFLSTGSPVSKPPARFSMKLKALGQMCFLYRFDLKLKHLFSIWTWDLYRWCHHLDCVIDIQKENLPNYSRH